MPEVKTVLGPISPEALGTTMCHVHLLSNLTVIAHGSPPELMTTTERAFRSKPITMDILGHIRRNYFSVDDNMVLADIDEAISEVMYYKRMGGASIVEATPIGIGRDPLGLRQISAATGVNIICSTGWYVAASHPAFVKEASVKDLAGHMVRELTRGIDATGIKPGIIKIALSGKTPEAPFNGDEEKVLRACARAQAETGAALNIHPCHHYGLARHHKTYIDILKKEGARLEKCIFSHMEFWWRDIAYQKSVLDMGVPAAFDQFGSEEYVRPGYAKASDLARVDCVVELVKSGYAKQLVLSNEIAHRSFLRKYGGYGYAHVLENIVPDLKYYGVTQEQLDNMLVDNMKRLLPF